jgi:hypothetical protein
MSLYEPKSGSWTGLSNHSSRLQHRLIKGQSSPGMNLKSG